MLKGNSDNLQFVVSEWGFLTEFNNFDDALEYCINHDIIYSGDGMLWIQSKDREALEHYIKNGLVDHSYMGFKHMGEDNNWIWDSFMEEWEDATETEECGKEDFDEKYEERKKYIEDKYGKNHGKTQIK